MKKMMQGSLAAAFICVLFLVIMLCSGLRPADASTCGFPNGPKTATMVADVNEFKACDTLQGLSPPGYIWATLSGTSSGSPLANGMYPGYCVDLTGSILDNPIFGNVVYTVNFWSSLDPNLPTSVKTVTDPVTKISYTIPWDKINYLLNTYPNESWLNLQAAYWDLVHGCIQLPGSLYTCDTLRTAPYYFPYGTTNANGPFGCPTSNPQVVDEVRVQFLVNDTNANGSGFIPKAGDKIASVGQITNCTPSTTCNQYLPYQVIFVPTTCPTCTGSVGDKVWMDKNGDGYQDVNEPGIKGVAVNLTGTDAYGQPISLTTTTDDVGDYQFNQLCTGDYEITVAIPADYSPTIIGSSNGDDNIAYDSNNPVGTTFKITTDTSSNLTVDFGFVPVCSGSIGDLVWKDLDGNGMQEGNDPVLSGVNLELTGTNTYGQTITKTATTNSLGTYSFDALCQGSYNVKVVSGIPAGFYPTAPFSSNGNDLLPNDSNNPDGTAVNLTSDKDANPTVDFGYTPKCQGTIGNFVWKDLNENGLQDQGEPGIEKVKVSLGGTNAYGQLISMTVYTDANGIYQFDGLCQSGANGYTVTVDSTTAPAGWIPTAPLIPDGDILNDTDSNDPKGTIVNLAGDSAANNTIDFGYIPDCKASIGNFVWEDKNGDGVQNDLNSGIFGVEVLLTGTNDYGQPVKLSSNSSATGYYEFTGLCKGDYTVAVNADSTNFQGLKITSPVSSNGNDGNDSDSNNPVSTAVTLSDDTTPNLMIDFGYIKPASIGNYVWDDLNHDGIQSEYEKGIVGVTVELYKCDGTFVASMQTTAGGFYKFENLLPGSYYVKFIAPDGYSLTLQNAGNDNSIDSDADTTTGTTGCYTLASGEYNNTVDAGLFKPASIGDYVWNDANHNGVQDAGEMGIANVTVKLYNCLTNALVATTTTDASGKYTFPNLIAGNYRVEFVAPSGYSFTTPFQGGNSALDSDANGSGVTACFDLMAGESNTSIDAGLFKAMPSIDIRKQAEGPDSRSFAAKSDVPFTIVVTNTGNVTLTGVKVTDAQVPGCANDAIGTLNPGQPITYTCTAVSVQQSFTNTACVNAQYATTPVSDCDDSTVLVPNIDIIKYVSPDGINWFHTDQNNILKIALCQTCVEDYDKDHCDYDRDGKCDEKDVDYCKYNKYNCDKHDSEHGSSKRKHRCDDSSNKSYCDDKSRDAHERDHGDYNNDGKCDERDVDYCSSNKSTCDRHDADRHSIRRNFRCDDSSSKTWCENKKKDAEESDKDRSDYNRDGKCDERDVDYCKNSKYSCDQFDRDRNNLKRRFRCDDSSNSGLCEEKSREEHEKDDSDYNRDGKCDERDIDYCKSNRSTCDQHDKNHGNSKRSHKCDDSSDKSACEGKARQEHDKDRGDYNRDGKHDERDIDFCKNNRERCIKHDRDHDNCKRSYRCDDSYNKSTCDGYAQREHDKDSSDYNHDGKCDEKDIEHCKGDQGRCDKHDKDRGQSKRVYRCDDSDHEDDCRSNAQREHDKDRSDYNRDGKRDERDIEFCKGEEEECIKHDKGHGNFKRSYRCDESSNKTSCESTRYSEDKSDRDRSDYNRDGRCDERDVNYCKYNASTCNKFDSERGNKKRTYRCDDSYDRSSCEAKAEYEHERDHGDYNRDGKCDERDIDLCKNSPYGCDDHDRKHGDSKRHYRCEDSSDRTRCESQSKEEYDHESSCSGSGGTPPVTCGKVYFKFVTTNVGSESLTNLTLTDSVYSLNSCVKPASLPAGESFTCLIGPLPALAGQHVNTATATGMSGTVKVEDMDKGYYYGCDGSAAKSPGYWKNHPEAWPVDSIIIGGKTYTKAQAISLMSSPVSGDKTYTLFKALVAAKLDAMGCGDSSCVIATIASSDAWMALHPVGSGVAGDSSAWKQAEPWYLILDDYINGKLQCGGGDVCTPPPPPAPTCGQCSGGVTKLTLKYTGYSNATVTVKDSSGQILFNGTVAAYSSFSFNSQVAGSSMGQYVKIYVNGSYKATIYTDCSKSIYPGMGVGSFTVVEGYSLNGGKFCRVSSSSCTSDDDHHYSKDYCDSHDGESSCSSSLFSFDKDSDYSSWGSWSSHDD